MGRCLFGLALWLAGCRLVWVYADWKVAVGVYLVMCGHYIEKHNEEGE